MLVALWQDFLHHVGSRPSGKEPRESVFNGEEKLGR